MYDYGVSNLAQGFFQGRQRAMDEQELERQRQRQQRADQRVEEEYAYTQRRRQVEDPLRDRTMTAQAQGAELGLTKTRKELEEWEAGAPARAATRDLQTREARWGLENLDANKAAQRQLKSLQVELARTNVSNARLRGQSEQLDLDTKRRTAESERYLSEVATPLMVAIQSGDEEALRRVAPDLNPRGLRRNDERGSYNIVVDLPTGEVDEAGNPVLKPTPIVGETPESIASKIALIQNPQVGSKMLLYYYATRAAQSGERVRLAAERLEVRRKALYSTLEKSPMFQNLSVEEQLVEMGKIDMQIANELAEAADEDGDGIPDSEERERPGLSYHIDRGGRGAKQGGDAPYGEGEELIGPGGKTYVVRNGVPVLKE